MIFSLDTVNVTNFGPYTLMLRYIRISIYRQVIVVNPNKHLERRVKGTVQPGERIYVGVSLVDVKYPDLVVIVERVWATASTDPD